MESDMLSGMLKKLKKGILSKSVILPAHGITVMLSIMLQELTDPERLVICMFVRILRTEKMKIFRSYLAVILQISD